MRSPLRFSSALLFPFLCALALAHEDDPKVRDRQPPVVARGYRAAEWGRGGGFEVGTEVFASDGVTLLAWIPLGELGATSGNDCWGYTSPSGRRYALFGSSDGTHVVEVSNPSAPDVVGFINGPDSLWRGLKVYGTRAYAVSEGGSGIQVINLANVDAGVVALENVVLAGGETSTHTIAIDEQSGFLYRCGGGFGGSLGMRMYSLANPASPALVGSWHDRYVHEAQVRTYTSGPYAGKQIAFCCGGFNGGFVQTGISILDVTNKANPVHRGQVTWPGAKFSHQAWLAPDGVTLFINDELDESGELPTTTYVVDGANIDQPQYLGSFTNGNTAVGHNLYLHGNLLYEANYRSGLRVFDPSSPLDSQEIAWFDTDPSGDGATFNGLWSNYPFFAGPNGGLVIGGDIERGLFVLWVGEPLVGLAIEGGAPQVLDPAGATLAVMMSEVTAGSYVPGTAKLHYDAGAGPVEVDLVDQGGGAFEAQFPALPCGTDVQYYLSADSSDGVTWIEPPNGAIYSAIVALGADLVLADDFEADQGWTAGVPSDTAVSGAWERGDPVGTPAQPEDDAGPGTQCYFTGQGAPGGLMGDDDVSGGKTTLVSPPLDLGGSVDPRIRYKRWYSNVKGVNPGMDVFVVDISNNGGASWVNVETIGPVGLGTYGGWVEHEFRVSDFVTATAAVQVRFVASDAGAPSIIEAAVDEFEVVGVGCGDCNGDGIADALQIESGALLDLDGEGTPDECQPLSADTGALSASAGGTVSFTLKGGAAHGSELYLVLGTLSGTEPGFDVGAVHIPLVLDSYTTHTISHAGSPPLIGTFGVLDAAGAGTAQFALVPAMPSLAGLLAHHAWVGVDPTSAAVTLASNALPLSFDP